MFVWSRNTLLITFNIQEQIKKDNLTAESLGMSLKEIVNEKKAASVWYTI